MSKPKHRRCLVCNQVTSRYVRAQRAGAVTVHIWATDDQNGEVQVGYRRYYCTAHAPVAAAAS